MPQVRLTRQTEQDVKESLPDERIVLAKHWSPTTGISAWIVTFSDYGRSGMSLMEKTSGETAWTTIDFRDLHNEKVSGNLVWEHEDLLAQTRIWARHGTTRETLRLVQLLAQRDKHPLDIQEPAEFLNGLSPRLHHTHMEQVETTTTYVFPGLDHNHSTRTTPALQQTIDLRLSWVTHRSCGIHVQSDHANTNVSINVGTSIAFGHFDVEMTGKGKSNLISGS